MADSKISALSDGGAVQTGDNFVVARSGANYKIAGTKVGVTIFDSTLGADTASIDTGAAGIPSGFSSINVVFVGRTDDATAFGPVAVILNNDTSAIYDIQYTFGSGTTTSSGTSLAQTSWSMSVHGNTGSTGYPGLFQLIIPAYADTTFWKVAQYIGGRPDATAANESTETRCFGYRSTTAISRLAVTATGTQKLKAGSRLTIYGLP